MQWSLIAVKYMPIFELFLNSDTWSSYLPKFVVMLLSLELILIVWFLPILLKIWDLTTDLWI